MNTYDKNVMVIVVTHNRKKLLERCLRALMEQTVEPKYICIVDNASTDGTQDTVHAFQDSVPNKIIYHRQEENLGGAGGFRRGFQLAQELPGWNWLMVMDDDAAPCPDYTEKLLQAAGLHPDVRGFIGTEYVGNSDRIAYGGRRTIEKYRTMREKTVPPEKYTEPFLYVDIVTFVGLMFHKSIVEKTGCPDDSLFIYYDDTDYCIRARKHTRIIQVTDARIIHRENFEQDVIENGKKEWRRYYLYRNELVIKKRYIPSFGVRYAWIGKRCLLKIIQVLREDENKARGVWLILRATFDVLCNRLGKAEYVNYD